MSRYVLKYTKTWNSKNNIEFDKDVSCYCISFCSKVKDVPIDIIKQNDSTYKVLVVPVRFEYF